MGYKMKPSSFKSGLGGVHAEEMKQELQEPMQGLTWMKDGKKQFVTKEQFLQNWDKHMADLKDNGADQAAISKAMSWKKASEQRLK